MHGQFPHDSATSNVLAWTSHSTGIEPFAEEEKGEVDEPPENPIQLSPVSQHFKRGPVRHGSDHPESLLTKALQSHSEDESYESNPAGRQRRRSMTSNVSLASTADLTCDTGITTPARTTSPSPRLPALGFVPLPANTRNLGKAVAQPAAPVPTVAPTHSQTNTDKKDPAVQALEKKRCISFACAAKPKTEAQVSMPPPPPVSAANALKTAVQDAPKRSCLRFACPSRPKSTPPQRPSVLTNTPTTKTISHKVPSPSVTKHRSPSAARSARSLTPRRSAQSPTATRSKRYLTANTKDLQSECSRFHEFASDEPQEDDWLRRDDTPVVQDRKLTIHDTLEKENAIRKLGKEAEEEAELEEELEEEEENGDEDDLPDGDEEDQLAIDDGGEDATLEGDESDFGSDDDDVSDGYHTDNEVGFADSEDEDDELVLWTTGKVSKLSLSGATPVVRRRSSIDEPLSDSSANEKPRYRHSRPRNAVVRPVTPELPDSTDFVCGTLDEDRPLEEAYISCLAARKQEKLRPIPQDIDPSFPTSEPEDDDDGAKDLIKTGHHGSDEPMWLHGELEDIHHETDRVDRRKRKDISPKRYHSPPPKRHHSPAPKGRGRSPYRLCDRHSPKRMKSPLPPGQVTKSPPASPVRTGRGIPFKPLPIQPGMVFTKSLPRAPAVFPQQKKRGRATTSHKQSHVRGAIDIVKGLEQKRQRRKEKFYQKYCTRARKNQIQEKRPAPGQGAERMREVGLLMAGKSRTGHYVLSI